MCFSLVLWICIPFIASSPCRLGGLRFIDFIDWYLLAFQSKEHSDVTLEEMDKLIRKSVRSMKKHVRHFQKSGFDLVKVHAMSHLKDCIKRCGLPSEYDTGIYEHLHIALMKIPYRHSNRRNFMGQMVRHNQRLRILGDEADLHNCELLLSIEDVTALDKVNLRFFFDGLLRLNCQF